MMQDPALSGASPLPPAPHLQPRPVSWQHTLTWFEDALRLFKRGAAVWVALAVLTIATHLVFDLIGPPWSLLGNVLASLVGCGMLYAAAAADRHAAPRIADAWRAFRAPTSTIVAIVLASFVTFGAEALAAWWLADVNLLATRDVDQLAPSTVMGIYAIGVLASLPVTFVPLHVLLEPVELGEAFEASWQAFVLNTIPLLVYAAMSLVLLAIGLATMGLGLLIVLPIWAASSYTAWRDIFAVGEAPVVE